MVFLVKPSVSKGESQGIAIIEIEKTGNETATLQIRDY